VIFTGRPTVPVPDTSLTDYILRRAGEYPERIAAVDLAGEESYTYGDLVAGVNSAAAALRARGFGRGQVLAMLAPNGPAYPIAYHAAVAAGGAVMLLNPLDTPEDLAGHLNEAAARFVVTVPADAERVLALTGGTKVEEVFVFGEAPGTTPFAELLAHPADGTGAAIEPATDVSTILHSSGSTGYPKGVLLTHRNMAANVMHTREVAPLGEDERVLAVPPFHHAFGMIMVLNASLVQGATLVTMPRFDPEGYLRAIQEHSITRLYIVPTMAVLLARSPLVDQYDMTSVRGAVSGGAALDPEIAAAVRARMGLRIGQGYGLTEGLVSFMQTPEHYGDGSVGIASPGVEFKVVDTTTGAALGPGQDGEVLIRGAHVMKGYLNAEEATRQVLEPDGFLHSGDLGHVGPDGQLYLVDRIKELIKYKGQQVSPVELEAVLMTHPGVADAAVVGVPDEEASEIPKAFVVAKNGSEASAEQIMAFVAERVAPYKKIRRVEFIDAIPRTPVGKIQRRTLKEAGTAAQ